MLAGAGGGGSGGWAPGWDPREWSDLVPTSPIALSLTHLHAGLFDCLHQKHLVGGPLLIVDAVLRHRGRPGGWIVGRRDFHSWWAEARRAQDVYQCAARPSGRLLAAEAEKHASPRGLSVGGITSSSPPSPPSFRPSLLPFQEAVPGRQLTQGAAPGAPPCYAYFCSRVPARESPSSGGGCVERELVG